MIARIAALAAAGALLGGAPLAAKAPGALQMAQAGVTTYDVPGEPHPRLRRARTRIEVVPARPPHRECVSRLEPEWRPSGTVIVPRLRCWWAR